MDGLACSFENCNASIKAISELVGNFDVQNGDVERLAEDYNIKLNLPDQIAHLGAEIKFASETAD